LIDFSDCWAVWRFCPASIDKFPDIISDPALSGTPGIISVMQLNDNSDIVSDVMIRDFA
jgi:hypothetical protein